MIPHLARQLLIAFTGLSFAACGVVTTKAPTNDSSQQSNQSPDDGTRAALAILTRQPWSITSYQNGIRPLVTGRMWFGGNGMVTEDAYVAFDDGTPTTLTSNGTFTLSASGQLVTTIGGQSWIYSATITSSQVTLRPQGAPDGTYTLLQPTN